MLSLRSIAGIAVALFAISAFSNTVVTDPSKRKGAGPLFQIRRGKKWGFMDRTGKIVIPPRFDAEQDFFHGLAAVSIRDKWGFIDEKGKVRIPAQFDDALSFLDDQAPVRIGRKWGYVDLSGRMVIEPRFQAADEFHEGFARVYAWTKTTCLREKYTSEDAPEIAFRFPEFDPAFMACFEEDGLIGIIDKSGRFVVPPRLFRAESFSEGLAAVREEGREGKWGYVDATGEFAIKPRFNQAFSFSEGRARVEVSAHNVGNRMVDIAWGFIDKSGQLAIPAQYHGASDFSEGLAAIEIQIGNRSSWAFIDTSGQIMIPGPFFGAQPFSDGLAQVLPFRQDWMYVDHSGNPILRGVGAWHFVDGLAIAGQLGRQIYIDKKGRKVGAYEEGKE